MELCQTAAMVTLSTEERERPEGSIKRWRWRSEVCLTTMNQSATMTSSIGAITPRHAHRPLCQRHRSFRQLNHHKLDWQITTLNQVRFLYLCVLNWM